MADEAIRQKQYDYHTNSNLVLDAGRRRARDAEPTGEVETLRNRMVCQGVVCDQEKQTCLSICSLGMSVGRDSDG